MCHFSVLSAFAIILWGLDVQKREQTFLLLLNTGIYTVTSSLLLQSQVVQIRVRIIYINQPVCQNRPRMQEKEHYLSSCIFLLQLHSPFYFTSVHYALFPLFLYLRVSFVLSHQGLFLFYGPKQRTRPF